MIALTKILSIPVKVWFELNTSSSEDYEFVGVHSGYQPRDSIMEAFRKAVPANAELVVDFKLYRSTTEKFDYATGTALIHK